MPPATMPELPDLTIYLEHLDRLIVGQKLAAITLASPFVLRTVSPSVAEVVGHEVVSLSRIGKQIVITLEDDLHLVIHLMISGRLQWRDKGKAKAGRIGLAVFEFSNGSLLFTEASKKKRASLRIIAGSAQLKQLDLGGSEVFACSLEEFIARLHASNHTLKRALTDQRIFAGIGNAYSDEILLRAKLSPFKRAGSLGIEDATNLYAATRDVMQEWTDRLREEAGQTFPKKVTAFHKQMAVHGKFKQPCPQCGAPVQRIVYAENESNYCARCQTNGKLLADRSLSKLLKASWPKRIEDLEP